MKKDGKNTGTSDGAGISSQEAIRKKLVKIISFDKYKSEEEFLVCLKEITTDFVP